MQATARELVHKELQFFAKTPGLVSPPTGLKFTCLHVVIIAQRGCDWWVITWGTASKRSKVNILLSGREIPEYCKEGSVSFMVPQDLYDKFLGLVLCFVLGPKEGKVVNRASYKVNVLVNDDLGVSSHAMNFYPMKSDHVWYICFPCTILIGGWDYLRKDWNHFQVCHRLSKGSIKKCGFHLICKQQEDDLRVVLPTPSADRNKLEFSRKETQRKTFSINTEEEDSPSETDVEEILSSLTEKRRVS